MDNFVNKTDDVGDVSHAIMNTEGNCMLSISGIELEPFESYLSEFRNDLKAELAGISDIKW